MPKYRVVQMHGASGYVHRGHKRLSLKKAKKIKKELQKESRGGVIIVPEERGS